MGVGIDQTRHHEMPGKVDRLVEAGWSGVVSLRAGAGDAPVDEGDPAIGEDRVLAVDGQHRRVVNQQRTHLTNVCKALYIGM